MLSCCVQIHMPLSLQTMFHEILLFHLLQIGVEFNTLTEPCYPRVSHYMT